MPLLNIFSFISEKGSFEISLSWYSINVIGKTPDRTICFELLCQYVAPKKVFASYREWNGAKLNTGTTITCGDVCGEGGGLEKRYVF